MILNDLITKFSWDEIKTRIIELYPDQEINIDLYERVFNTLKTLEIHFDDRKIQLLLEKVFQEDEEWIDVTGYIEGEEFRYSLQFFRWENWLGLEIFSKTLEFLPEIDILVHSLWEMTFSGFTQEDIEKAKLGVDNLSEKEEFDLITLNEELKIQVPKIMNEDEREKTIGFFSDLLKDENQAKAFFAKLKHDQDSEYN
ncbi:MAG TPA: DUF6557 family protein [Candidatus Bathyarchaeia archaeon]|nr:DUF6557 family protein [Candidatus Bathyarchaeia archaeon]